MPKKEIDTTINPEIIKWVRESAGWSIKEIAKKLKISEDEYKKIELGKKRPTFRQLELLAKYFKRPVAVFFLPQPPDEPSITSSFRILPQSKTEFSKELRLAIRKARYYQSIANELMKDLGLSTKPQIQTLTLDSNPQKVAKEERKNFGISLEQQYNWDNAYEAFNTWRFAIESKNILVFQFKFSIEEARGFCLIDNDPPVIVINSNDNILARIFTLFHEFAHIILGVTEIYTGEEELIINKDVENWCDSFASEFLIPAEALEEDKDFQAFKQAKTKILSPKLLQNLSKKFKISQQAILTRLKTLNLIDYNAYKNEFLKLKKQFEEPSKKGGFLSPEQKCIQEKGKRFVSIVLESKDKGIITTADVIEYLAIKYKHLNKLIELNAK